MASIHLLHGLTSPKTLTLPKFHSSFPSTIATRSLSFPKPTSKTTTITCTATPATDRLISAVSYTLPFFNSLQYSRYLFPQFPKLGLVFDANDDISSLERCETCFRYKEAGDAGYLNLGDCRQLCSDCSSIAVKSREECDIIIQNVFEFFRSLNLQVNENIPIVFINKNQIRNILKGSGLGDREIRGADGLFYPSVSTVVQRLSTYSLPFKIRYVLMHILRKLTTICTIQLREEYSRSGLKSLNFGKYVKFLLGDTILVLSGKPDVAMGSILAHETMHGWFRSLGKACECERSVEEGICEVMSYKWLQWFSSKGFNSLHKTNEQVQYTRTLKEGLVRDIEWNDNEVYGQGFRNAMLAIETFKFKPTLDHIVKNGTLPVVAPLPLGKTSDELVRKKTTTTSPGPQ